MTIKYNGKSFDPLQTNNDLSLLLAKKAAQNISYQYDQSNDLANEVCAKIR